MTFMENNLVPEARIAVMVLSPLVHFLVNEMTNWSSLTTQEFMVIVVSVVVHDFTPVRLIGSVNVSVVLSE